MTTTSTLQTVTFESVPLGSSFKEEEDGVWHLKTSATKGTYQSWGTRYEPSFAQDVLVLVE